MTSQQKAKAKVETLISPRDLPEQLKLDNQVCFPLYSASNAIVRAYRPYLDELDLTYLQYIVLMVLWEKGSVNVKTLGERIKLNSGTLTPLLKRLEVKGIVTRTRCPEDERGRIITITDAGLLLKERAAPIPKQLACKVGLSLEEFKQLSQLCHRVLNALDDGNKYPSSSRT